MVNFSDFSNLTLLPETFDFFATNMRCKHIFFGGCNNLGYLSKISSRLEEKGRITLIRNMTTLPEFEHLEFPMIYLHTVFETAPLETTRLLPPTSTKHCAEMGTSDRRRNVCIFYLKVWRRLHCVCVCDTALTTFRISANSA